MPASLSLPPLIPLRHVGDGLPGGRARRNWNLAPYIAPYVCLAAGDVRRGPQDDTNSRWLARPQPRATVFPLEPRALPAGYRAHRRKIPRQIAANARDGGCRTACRTTGKHVIMRRIYGPRRGARVAESGSLENCCPGNGTVGSIPTLSAKLSSLVPPALAGC